MPLSSPRDYLPLDGLLRPDEQPRPPPADDYDLAMGDSPASRYYDGYLEVLANTSDY